MPDKLKLKLVKHNDPILKKPAKGISEVTPELIKIVTLMIQCMYENKGIGLAAPQVGIPARLIVMHVFDQEGLENETGENEEFEPSKMISGRSLVLLNPEIKTKTGMTIYEEGCLSFPGIKVPVKRATEVIVSHANLSTGEYIETTFKGINAVCVQHEIDHLNGKTFLDQYDRKKRRMILKGINS